MIKDTAIVLGFYSDPTDYQVYNYAPETVLRAKTATPEAVAKTQAAERVAHMLMQHLQDHSRREPATRGQLLPWDAFSLVC